VDNFKPKKLAKTHHKAGIEKCFCKLTSLAYLCLVDREKIELGKNNNYNFRDHVKSHSLELKDSFNRRAVRNPILVYVKGKLLPIDGRHTLWMMEMMEHQKYITCEIHFGVNKATCAAIFHELTQNSRRMNVWDAFSAALEAEYPFAVDIEDGLTQWGFSIPNTPGFNTRTADIRSLTPLTEAYSHDILNELFEILSLWRSKRGLEYQAGGNGFLRGLVDFIRAYGDASIEDIKDRLGRRSAAEIFRIAQNSCRDDTDRPNRSACFAAMEQVYNIGNRRRAA